MGGILMDKIEETTIKFLGYYVREINFLKNDNFKGEKINLELKMTKNSTYLDDNKVKINLNVKIFEEAITKNFPFSLSLVTTGIFQYNHISIEEDHKREMLEKKLIDILYPYVRASVSNITMTSNLPPLYLPTLNINNFIKSDA